MIGQPRIFVNADVFGNAINVSLKSILTFNMTFFKMFKLR